MHAWEQNSIKLVENKGISIQENEVKVSSVKWKAVTPMLLLESEKLMSMG